VYIKGATALPWVNTIKEPNKTKIIRIGNNQYFFLDLRKFQNSIRKLIKIDYPLI
jgi:hypothetical protein